jgi:hypothetical protein
MARARLSSLAADVIGTQAGVTFRRHRGLTIISNKPHTRRHRLADQVPRTTALAQLVYRWKNTLTAAQRSGWENFAINPSLYYNTHAPASLPGMHSYLQENLARDRAGITILDDAPTVPRILAPPAAVVQFALNDRWLLSGTGQLPQAGEWFFCSLTKGYSPGVTNPRTWFRQHWLRTGPQVGGSFQLIDAPLSIGSLVQIHIRLFANAGRFSEPFVFFGTWPA